MDQVSEGGAASSAATLSFWSGCSFPRSGGLTGTCIEGLGLFENGLVEAGQAGPGIQSKVVGQPGAQLGLVPNILGRAGPLYKGCEPALVQRVTLDLQQIAR
jgi:hypothetical protein